MTVVAQADLVNAVSVDELELLGSNPTLSQLLMYVRDGSQTTENAKHRKVALDVLRTLLSPVLRGHRHGLAISNNVADATNDIDIGAGQASVFNGTIWKIVDYAGGTGRLDANWAVGTNQGKLDAGTKANSTWYYIWLIHRSDTNVTDLLFSTSATSPTMPANYDYRVRLRVGAMVTNSAGVIRAGTWHVDAGYFTYASSILELNITSAFVSAVTVTAPPGFVWLGAYQYGDLNAGVGFIASSASGNHQGRTQNPSIYNFATPLAPIRLSSNSLVSISPQTVNTVGQAISTFGFAEQ